MPKQTSKKKTEERINYKKYPTLKFKTDRDIAMDFALRVYQKFDKMVKSIILFGSAAKEKMKVGSDIDVIIIIDDASIKFDEKLVLWYREELGKIIQANPYKKDFHINTIKLTTWWQDLSKGDPTIINVLRYGEALIDFGGFFNPLKILLQEGSIRPTSEAIYTALNRVPGHMTRSRIAEISALEGCYWAMVDSAQALLMSVNVSPPSPEKIPEMLNENFVNKRFLDIKYVHDFKKLHDLHKKVIHSEIKDLDGKIVDTWQEKSEVFFKVCVKLIDEILGK